MSINKSVSSFTSYASLNIKEDISVSFYSFCAGDRNVQACRGGKQENADMTHVKNTDVFYYHFLLSSLALLN